MDIIYFLTRYTPFWSIPMLFIAAEFAYLFWIRKKKKSMLFCVVIIMISIVLSALYYYAGGPEKSVQAVMRAHWFMTR